jgi:hypothetical protein
MFTLLFYIKSNAYREYLYSSSKEPSAIGEDKVINI